MRRAVAHVLALALQKTQQLPLTCNAVTAPIRSNPPNPRSTSLMLTRRRPDQAPANPRSAPCNRFAELTSPTSRPRSRPEPDQRATLRRLDTSAETEFDFHK